MPFQSEKQRKYLWANEPAIAREWTDTYGSKIQKADGGRIPFANGTFGPNINQILQQNRNFMVPLSSSPYQALGTWEKEGGLQSIYDKYAEASNLAGDYVDETYNVSDPYKSEGIAGDVRHIVGSSMAKDQLQNLLGDYITPGSPLAEKLTYGLGMFKTYAEELDDAIRIGKNTIKAGDWDKIWSGEFLTHPLEDIRANRIGLSIPYGATEKERLRAVPSLQTTNPFEDTMMGPKTYNKEGGIWDAIKNEFGGSAKAAGIPINKITQDSVPINKFGKTIAPLADEEEQYYTTGERIPRPNKWQRFLSKYTRQPFRPATGYTQGYTPAQLNRMNALGGWYSEPARQQRRDRRSVSTLLARKAAAEAGQGTWTTASQKNLNLKTMGSRPGHYDRPGGNGGVQGTSTPATPGGWHPGAAKEV